MSEDAEPERPKREPVGPDGILRPAFLLDYPDDPALNALIEAFESGNYAYVRAEAHRVAQAAQDPEVRDAALELRQRIEPDPLAKYLLGAALVLLVVVILWTYGGHSH